MFDRMGQCSAGFDEGPVGAMSKFELDRRSRAMLSCRNLGAFMGCLGAADEWVVTPERARRPRGQLSGFPAE